MKLLIASANRGKIAELTDLLKGLGIALVSFDDYPDMPETVEDGATFLENALKKAGAACEYTRFPALADDSGLEVDALDGRPGVLSARFGPTFEERNRRLLAMLETVPDSLRTARFVCTLALVKPDGFTWTTTGTVEGRIIREPRGDGGFGYDPVFFYEPYGKTFAELPAGQKNAVSHRGRALQAFRLAIENEGILG